MAQTLAWQTRAAPSSARALTDVPLFVLDRAAFQTALEQMTQPPRSPTNGSSAAATRLEHDAPAEAPLPS